MEKKLESLPSYIFYGKLTEGRGYCNEFDIVDSIHEGLYKYTDIQNVSYNLARALCTVSYIKDDDMSYTERCHFLYYWIGDTLYKYLKSEHLFSPIIDELYTAANKFKVPNKCNIIYHNISKDFFNKRKIVYDYIQNYKTIKQSLTDHGYSCNREYKNYISKSVRIYNEVYNTCNGNSDTYCMKFQENFTKYNHDELSKLSCNLEQERPVEPPRVGARGSLNDAELDIPSPQFHVAAVAPHLGSVGLPSEGASSSKRSDAVMSVIFPIIGIFLVCFTLYRFTPLWPWIHSYLIRKKIIRRNIEDIEPLELMKHTSEKDQRNFCRARFNVAYHTAEDSLL
ncbi:PIR Superfamily Protein [Plasmodium ovale wallikeri]|uniref:PIR Superfamily Protein n=1 Tax=Plasmodium ovale wallikeri TaxID=864142 RepID=A0A1A9A8U8_PLAOA|nr:PIR Superfamily Protein [Plasmodium ovale wallikeri]SBT55583.1 PIR Superfamily Protein [Plasmodium ovale wallikeri]